MHVQSCCSVNLSYCCFAVLVHITVVVAPPLLPGFASASCGQNCEKPICEGKKERFQKYSHKSGYFWNRILFSTNRPSIRPYETSAGICSPSPKSHLFETAHKNGLFGPVVNWNPIHPLCQLRHRHLKYWVARRTTTFCLLGYCALNSSGIIFYLLSRSTKLQLIADVGKLLRLKRLPVNVFHWLSLYRPTRRMNRWKQAQKWRSP